MAIPNDRTAEKRVKKVIRLYKQLANRTDTLLEVLYRLRDGTATLDQVEKAATNVDNVLWDINDVVKE